MDSSQLIGCVRRALVLVGAVLGIALPSSGVASADTPVQLKSRLGDNLCLDAISGDAFAGNYQYRDYPKAVINPCNGSKSQLWIFNSAGQIENVPITGMCLYTPGALDGLPVFLQACQGPQSNPDAERWNLQSNGQVTSALGPCLAVFGSAAAPGVGVSVFHCLPDAAGQQWNSVS